MFKSLLANVAAVSAVLFPVGSAVAAEHKDPLSLWVKQVNRQIDLRAEMPDRDVAGKAVIAFRRGADGRPYDVAALRGNPAVAEAGIRTIQHLRDLPPLPAGLPANQRIAMNYLVGTPSQSWNFQEETAKLLASADKTNAEIAASISGAQVALLDR